MAGQVVTSGTLYVVATPLGHLGDLTARAVDVLRAVDVVAAEDTRRTRPLLSHIDAHPELMSLHAHSPAGRLDALVASLDAGRSVALVTDAGTPAISDPGADLVARVRAAGHPVIPIPGPSAVVTALSVSGFGADRFTFLGFPPRRGRARLDVIEFAARSSWTSVLYEAPGRLARLLADLSEVCGPSRQAAVARELTKVHEEVRTGTLADLAGYYSEHEPRGEVTVVLAGAGSDAASAAPAAVPVATAASPDPDVIRERVATWRREGQSNRDIARRLVEEFHLPRNDAYRLVTGR